MKTFYVIVNKGQKHNPRGRTAYGPYATEEAAVDAVAARPSMSMAGAVVVEVRRVLKAVITVTDVEVAQEIGQ